MPTSKLLTRLLFGSSLMLLTAACGPEDNNATDGNNSQMAADMGGGGSDQGGGGADQGGGTTDMGGGTTDQGGGGTTDMGGGTTDMGGGGPDLSTAESFNDTVFGLTVQAYCDAIWECPDKAGSLVIGLGRLESREKCAEVFTMLIGDNTTQATAEGRLSYDAAKAQTCYDEALPQLSMPACDFLDFIENNSEISTCDEVFTGLVAVDANCLNDDECTEGNFCDYSENDGSTCYASCQPEPCGGGCTDAEYCIDLDGTDVCAMRVAQGEECFFEGDDECVEGSYCDDVTEVCVDEGGDETTYTFGDMGDVCNIVNNTWCKPGLTCVDIVSPSFDGVCGTPKPEGGSCYIDLECAYGSHCAGEDIGAMTSGACTLSKATGMACEESSECESDFCDNGTCASEEVCTVP